ncbi:MAG: hypothetical protein V4539_10355 [Bacteroidota bacterium]
MNKANMEAIKARLNALGFDLQVEEKLTAQVCFNPAAFDLGFCKTSGEDKCTFLVHFERADDRQYEVAFYTACLHKGFVLSGSSRVVTEQMEKIDWNQIAYYRNSFAVPVELSVLQSAYAVLQEAAKLSDASLVLYKYWAGTTLESLIPGVASLKSRYELSQRFYLSEDHPPITSGEAMRFLQNRWTERQMQQSRLQRRQTEVGTKESGSKKTSRRKVGRKK